ncbi:hypothetical protein WJX84_002143 [Apatococcus fuscideae]|uniref:Uncharacterized protein n=1 Tax=Apatococcus fuscideae TaxID=2026836 RepID=A0AAW1SRZ4_9CHLO
MPGLLQETYVFVERIKLLITGRAASGKTALVRSLCSLPAAPSAATLGVVVQARTCQVAKAPPGHELRELCFWEGR